jgi:hypothetical protein
MPMLRGSFLFIAPPLLSLLSGGSVLARADDRPSCERYHVSQLAPASSEPAPSALASPVAGAPAIPNEGLVIGEILELSLIDSSALGIRPAQMLARIRVRLISVQDVPSKSNFLTGKTGEVLEVYARDTVPAELVGRRIKGKIVFRGDERGGSYWISELAAAGSADDGGRQ